MRAMIAALLCVMALPLLAAETITLSVNESRSFAMMGASAAWSLDASIAGASAKNGTVTVSGRAPGRATIMVVSFTGEKPLEVAVVAPPGRTGQPSRTPPARATAEVRYSSAAREIQNSVTVHTQNSQAAARVVHHASDAPGAHARTSIATASYRIFDRRRELTLFDRDVDHSPLTLVRTPLRGVHYLDDRWRLHAGYTAYATYESFLIPVERQLVAGGGYAFRSGARSTITPSFFAFPGEGTVLSLMHEYRDGDRLFVRSELGFSRGVGAAAEVHYDTRRDRVRADLRYRGDDFAVAGTGTPRGLFSDASWSREYGRGSSVSAVVAATDAAGARVLAASADVDHRRNDHLSWIGGASWASFDGMRTITVPAGARIDFARGGVTALYRYARSETNRGGHGFRLGARASIGRFYASAFVDRQQNAPSLEVIFHERPDLALALTELGIAATSPADVARALREHAALAELGFIEGVTVDLAPLRTQFGLEISLLGTTAARHNLRARVLHNVMESVATRSATTIATVSYSRRLTASTDVFASYSLWRTQRRGHASVDQPIVEAGVRHRFDGLGGGSGAISGRVFADEDLDGVSDGAGVDAIVELDGTRRERTAADGSFAFKGVPRGSHRVVAHVPDMPHAYFTTPSRVEASAGEVVEFGVATTPARVNGRVISDAGEGIAGVRILLARGTRQHGAVSASDGTFAFAAAPGEWQLSLLTDSVPAGHSVAEAEPRAVQLDRETPLEATFSLRAHRSISGSGLPPHALIQVRPGARTTRADEEGRFLVRSLPAGETTLIVNGREHRVMLPNGPATVAVQLDQAGGWLVLLGAYRVAENAERTVARAREAGVDATIAKSGPLTIVRSGPYATREPAAEAVARLTRSGVDAVLQAAQ